METTIQTSGYVSGQALAGFRGGVNDILMRSENDKAEKLADEVAKHFWPMIGTANQVAYEAIDEAVEEMRAAGMLRQQEKVKALKALQEYERYQKTAYEHFKAIDDDRYPLWQDLIANASARLQPDVKRLYFAIKNELDRCGVQNSRVYASIQTGLALVTLATLMFDTMMSQFQRQTLVNITHAFKPGRLTAMESCWKAVGEITGKRCLQDVNLRDNEQCRLGVEVILQRYEKADFLNEAAGVALRHNPDVLTHEERKAFLQDDDLWNQENSESV
jgi:hypothetical protein